MKNSIRIERARFELSQAELAQKVGISRQAVHMIEKGKFIPSTVLAFKIASIFEMNVQDLFELEDSDWQQ